MGPFSLTGLPRRSYNDEEAGFRARLRLSGKGEREIAIWHTGPGEEYQASYPDENLFEVKNVKEAIDGGHHLADRVRFYVNGVLIPKIPAPGAPTLITRERVTVEIDWKDSVVTGKWGVAGTLRAQLLPPQANDKNEFEFEKKDEIGRNDEQHTQAYIDDAKRKEEPPPVFELQNQPLVDAAGTAPIGLTFWRVPNPSNERVRLTYEHGYQRWQVQIFSANGRDHARPVGLWNGDQEISSSSLEESLKQVVNLPAITIKPLRKGPFGFGEYVDQIELTITDKLRAACNRLWHPSAPNPAGNNREPEQPGGPASSPTTHKTADTPMESSTKPAAQPKKWYERGVIGWIVGVLKSLKDLLFFWREPAAT